MSRCRSGQQCKWLKILTYILLFNMPVTSNNWGTHAHGIQRNGIARRYVVGSLLRINEGVRVDSLTMFFFSSRICVGAFTVSHLFLLFSILPFYSFPFLRLVKQRERYSSCVGHVVDDSRDFFASCKYGCGWRYEICWYPDWLQGSGLPGCRVHDSIFEQFRLSAVLCDVCGWRKLVYSRSLEYLSR